MKTMSFVVAMVLGTILASSASGQINFTENFDSYGSCSGVCSLGTEVCNIDQLGFEQAWPIDAIPGTCTSGEVLHEYLNEDNCSGERWASYPFAYNIDKNGPRRNVKDLRPLIQAIDPVMDAINGTDDNPLVLTAHFDLHQLPLRAQTTAFFIQVFGGEEPAPIQMEDPSNPGTLTGIKLEYTTDAEGNCTLLNTTPVIPRRAIAVGFFGGGSESDGTYNGLVPKPPCGNFTNKNLTSDVLFDGEVWNHLVANHPVTGDAILTSKRKNLLTLTIKGTTMDLVADTNEYGILTMNDIPRKYTGPFQFLAIGSCVLTTFPAYMDNVSLTGGEPEIMPALEGACCLPDASCIVTDAASCSAAGGEYAGNNTLCEDQHCCGDPYPDADHDGDVDQKDFALFQKCITGTGGAVPPECECFDRDGVAGIGEDDFTLFLQCASGPSIQADPSCDD